MRVSFLIVAVGLLAAAAPRQAAAVSPDDLVGLAANGLGDTVLVDLIRSDGSTFQLSSRDVLTLHARGLSDAVLSAMLKTSRRPSEPATATAPSVVVQQTIVQQAIVQSSPNARVTNVVVAPVVVPQPTPVYWGFGGRPRPDAWKTTP
jgi:hypothetical protein